MTLLDGGPRPGEDYVPRHAAPVAASGLLPRAALALALVVAFPVLVLALVVVIVAANVAIAVAVKATAVVVIPSVLAVVALLGTLRPLVRAERRDTSRGVEVSTADEPALWVLVREVAAGVGTAPPDVVVLVPGADAAVHDETLLLGLVRRRRVLTLGLALLSLLDEPQLRAVLAHEHGHYAAGDTRLSALTYRTREAVERAAREMGPGVLGRVFGWYRERHVRLTESSGRAQELAADAAAHRLAGAEASVGALVRSAVGAPMFDAFLDQHVGPLVEAGRRPVDLYGGFRAYCSDPAVRLRAGGLLAFLLGEEEHPHDTHPPLRVRLAALGAHPEPGDPAPPLAADRPAAALLVGAARVEALLVPDDALPVTWPDVATEVLRPRLQARAARVWAAVPAGPNTDLGSVLATLVGRERESVVRALLPDLDRLVEVERREVLDEVGASAAEAVTTAAVLAAGAGRVEPAWGEPSGRVRLLARPDEDLDVLAELEPALQARDAAALLARVAELGADLAWSLPTEAVPPPGAAPALPLGVLPGLERRGRTVDLVVYGDALVVVPVGGADQARALLAVYGDVAGAVRRGAARRAGRLLDLTADDAAAVRRGCLRLPVTGVEATLTRRRLGSWRLRLTHEGGRVTLHDRRPLVSPPSAQALLERALPGLVTTR